MSSTPDDLSGYDTSLREPYSPDRVYSKLGSLHESRSIRDGMTKNPSKVPPWMHVLVCDMVGRHPHLWDSVSAFVRDSIYHRLHYLQTSDMLSGETAIEVRLAQRKAETYAVISRIQEYQETYESFREGWREADSSKEGQEMIKRAILAYAQDCPDHEWAERFRSIVA